MCAQRRWFCETALGRKKVGGVYPRAFLAACRPRLASAGTDPEEHLPTVTATHSPLLFVDIFWIPKGPTNHLSTSHRHHWCTLTAHMHSQRTTRCDGDVLPPSSVPAVTPSVATDDDDAATPAACRGTGGGAGGHSPVASGVVAASAAAGGGAGGSPVMIALAAAGSRLCPSMPVPTTATIHGPK